MPVNKSPVTALLGAGADAMSNLYDMNLTVPQWVLDRAQLSAPGAEPTTQLQLRAKGFTPPEIKPQTYEVKFKSVAIERVKTQLDFKRRTEVEFRLDSVYDLYRLFKAWQSGVAVGASGAVANAFGFEGEDVPGGDIANSDWFGLLEILAQATPLYDAGNATNNDGASQGLGVGDLNTTNSIAWAYKQLFVIEVGEPKFSTENADLQTIKVVFGFGEVTDPQGNDL